MSAKNPLEEAQDKLGQARDKLSRGDWSGALTLYREVIKTAPVGSLTYFEAARQIPVCERLLGKPYEDLCATFEALAVEAEQAGYRVISALTLRDLVRLHHTYGHSTTCMETLRRSDELLQRVLRWDTLEGHHVAAEIAINNGLRGRLQWGITAILDCERVLVQVMTECPSHDYGDARLDNLIAGIEVARSCMLSPFVTLKLLTKATQLGLARKRMTRVAEAWVLTFFGIKCRDNLKEWMRKRQLR